MSQDTRHLSLNGSPIQEIEKQARLTDGCSQGDKLLAQNESIVKVMADDNEKVKNMKLTHQDLARPLLYAQAFIEGGYGTNFKMQGADYKVSGSLTPRCGALSSPFNDNYFKSITFFKVTNLKTTKVVDFSYIHPYMINQYGFYGSHENRSYVNPEKIVEVFDYLKK